MCRIGVLISGGGTNLQAIIDAAFNGEIAGKVAYVVSNKEDAYGLTRARLAGIKNEVIPYEEGDKKLLQRFLEEDIDLVVLAGYLKVLSPEFVGAYPNRIINVHPSLIPSFCGDGYYGMHVHESAWDRGVKLSGATVHFVDEGTDTGPIIMQEAVTIDYDDNPKVIQKKVLATEHKILVKSIDLFCKNKLQVIGRRVRVLEGGKMKRALISVYDKAGIVEFAEGLKELGWEIVSTGGTFRLLQEEGIDCISIEDVTQFPEVLSGRVKTLNPRIHAGILYRRDNNEDIKTLDDLGVNSIDMVVNNLYPFEETLAKEGVGHEEIIENIDIGGPSMIRAAAKNYKDVIVVVDPADYESILQGLRDDSIDLGFKRNLARKVFNYTAYYDSLIAGYFNEEEDTMFPEYLTLGYKFKEEMRYGENPHQKAAFYVERKVRGSLAEARQLNGKALSFNNINDTNGALTILKEFEEPTAVAVKHSNPCGIASGNNLVEAYKAAYECDPVSIFGGIVAVNDMVDARLAEELYKIFLEVVVAPKFTEEALEILTKKSNLRLLELEDISYRNPKAMNLKKVDGGLLIQEQDQLLFDGDLEVVSKRKPSNEDMEELSFAWKAIKHGSSNGVCLVKNHATVGIGLGEVNRVWAVQNAIERAGDKAKDAYMASDGFFPFKDSIEALAQAGVKAVIQPGGSIRDQEVIDCIDENGMIMVFTGIRHFKH